MNTVAVFMYRGDNMKVELYNTTDNPNIVNKTLTRVRELNITFRQAIDEKAPVIIMHNTNIKGCNYVYIPDFQRYYFISNVSNYNNVLSRVTLTSDLLMTYQNAILNNQSLITATEKPSYLSASLPTQSTTSKRVVKSDVTLENKNSMILTTIGGISK